MSREKSIYLESGKILSVCEMPEEFGIKITYGSGVLSKEGAEFLIKELTNFVNNK
tara:strand:- start:1183 stop:1347 length:165 start_codon:yes stop_codon:yes gene_type:complete